MVTPTQLLAYVKAEPFRPFRLHMASGRTFDICHPAMLMVGKDSLMVFWYAADEHEIIDRWETVSLEAIESISHLDLAVGTLG
jgi:hypothetical protein